ncbi:MAG: VOC family protein [Patescibacteria group bacterium]
MKNMNPVVHFELPYEDRDRMSTFYETAFGWKANKLGEEMGNYVTVQTGETDKKNMLKKVGMINGGLYKKDASKGALYPSLVLATDDIQASMKKITEAGGKIQGEPMEIPGIGMFVGFIDTEGNSNSVLQPKSMEYSDHVNK